MRLFARVGLVTAFAAVALTAACSDSSGPSNIDTPSAIASRFDSIYVDAFARSDSGSNGYSTRAELATLLEIPAALGASPSTINVTTANGIEHWKGFEFVELTPPGGTADSEFVLLAYREAAAHTVLVVFFDSTGSGHSGGVITNDTLPLSPNSASGMTHVVSVGTTCSTPSASLRNPQFEHSLFTSCALATFQTSLSLTLTTSGAVDPALARLSFTASTVNGMRIVDPASNGRRVQLLLHTLHKQLTPL